MSNSPLFGETGAPMADAAAAPPGKQAARPAGYAGRVWAAVTWSGAFLLALLWFYGGNAPARAGLVALGLAPFFVGLYVLAQREANRVREDMQLHLHGWLMRRFGLPFGAQASAAQASFVGVLPGYRVLRQHIAFVSPTSHRCTAYQLEAHILLADERNQYWLVLFRSQRQRSAGQAITLVQPPAVLPMTELRVRRALFNDPAAYQRAFGEPPSRAGLDAWRRQHPEKAHEQGAAPATPAAWRL